jgi:hypothetical protein
MHPASEHAAGFRPAHIQERAATAGLLLRTYKTCMDCGGPRGPLTEDERGEWFNRCAECARRRKAGQSPARRATAAPLTAARRRELAEMYGGRPAPPAGPYKGIRPDPGAYNPGVIPSASQTAAARWLARQETRRD